MARPLTNQFLNTPDFPRHNYENQHKTRNTDTNKALRKLRGRSLLRKTDGNLIKCQTFVRLEASLCEPWDQPRSSHVTSD